MTSLKPLQLVHQVTGQSRGKSQKSWATRSLLLRCQDAKMRKGHRLHLFLCSCILQLRFLIVSVLHTDLQLVLAAFNRFSLVSVATFYRILCASRILFNVQWPFVLVLICGFKAREVHVQSRHLVAERSRETTNLQRWCSKRTRHCSGWDCSGEVCTWDSVACWKMMNLESTDQPVIPWYLLISTSGLRTGPLVTIWSTNINGWLSWPWFASQKPPQRRLIWRRDFGVRLWRAQALADSQNQHVQHAAVPIHQHESPSISLFLWYIVVLYIYIFICFSLPL